MHIIAQVRPVIVPGVVRIHCGLVGKVDDVIAHGPGISRMMCWNCIEALVGVIDAEGVGTDRLPTEDDIQGLIDVEDVADFAKDTEARSSRKERIPWSIPLLAVMAVTEFRAELRNKFPLAYSVIFGQ